MTMEIELHRKFKKKLYKIPPKIQEQFLEKVEIFIQDKYNETLENHSVDPTFPGCRSINITGDYRAIFSEDGDIITFVAIGTHAQLYK